MILHRKLRPRIADMTIKPEYRAAHLTDPSHPDVNRAKYFRPAFLMITREFENGAATAGPYDKAIKDLNLPYRANGHRQAGPNGVGRKPLIGEGPTNRHLFNQINELSVIG